MKALVIGCNGFIGSHLCAEFEAGGYEVVRCDLVGGDGVVAVDIMDQSSVEDALRRHRPDVLVNMAGQANVGLSWKKPQRTVELNTIGFINILEAVKATDPEIRVIGVGSSDEYGRLRDIGVDVTEDVAVNPITPYAVSKQAQELFAQLYVSSFGMDVCMIRLFNLGGAGQMKGFMIADFASGIADVEAGRSEFVKVGNLSSARDFTHVGDACKAVRLIAEKGHAGEVYNICSGTTHTAQEILDKLIAMARTEVKVVQDPARMRPSDTPVICGNHDKLTNHTGWRPELGLDQILEDALNYWRGER